MRKVILDSNFLFIPGYFGIDIIDGIEKLCPFAYELTVVKQTISELEKLRKTLRGKELQALKLAEAIVKKSHIRIIKTDEDLDADSAIVEIADPRHDIVATQDMGLKRRLRNKGVPLIILRQRRYLQLLE